MTRQDLKAGGAARGRRECAKTRSKLRVSGENPGEIWTCNYNSGGARLGRIATCVTPVSRLAAPRQRGFVFTGVPVRVSRPGHSFQKRVPILHAPHVLLASVLFTFTCAVFDTLWTL